MAPWTLVSVGFKQPLCQVKVFTKKYDWEILFLYLSSYQACQELPIFRYTETVEQVPGSSCPGKIQNQTGRQRLV